MVDIAADGGWLHTALGVMHLAQMVTQVRALAVVCEKVGTADGMGAGSGMGVGMGAGMGAGMGVGMGAGMGIGMLPAPI